LSGPDAAGGASRLRFADLKAELRWLRSAAKFKHDELFFC